MKNLFIIILALTVYSCLAPKKGLEKGYTRFSRKEKKLIVSGDSLTPMRLWMITNRKDSILLRQQSESIRPNENDELLQLFVKRLHRTVTDSLSMGVGIAAPQVGILKNVIWVQRFDKEKMPFEVYLNPVINFYSEEKIPCREGCLSIPGRIDTTQIRSRTIEIEYDCMNGTHEKETVEGFTSVIFQHEIDHLRGILFLDHLTQEAK